MRDGHIGHTPFTGSFNHKGKRKVFPPVGLIDVHVYGQAELSSKVKNGSDMVLRAIIQRGCAADGIRAQFDRLPHEVHGPHRAEESLLREGDDLDIDQSRADFTRLKDTTDTCEADNRVDIDVCPQCGGSRTGCHQGRTYGPFSNIFNRERTLDITGGPNCHLKASSRSKVANASCGNPICRQGLIEMDVRLYQAGSDQTLMSIDLHRSFCFCRLHDGRNAPIVNKNIDNSLRIGKTRVTNCDVYITMGFH
ncbi:hypothetical protein KLQU111869_27840 [Klebsiella quasipneumoniae subsp. similipneumoniae]|nr:Uncharacterised protein [Enterobacter hormaechei]